MFLTVEELYTHLHEEVVDAISRNDDTKPLVAINSAVGQVKNLLSARYDIDTIFGATGDDRDPYILLLVKDIAVWHFVCLGNICTDMELREKRYNDAITWLTAAGTDDMPADLPRKKLDEDGDGVNEHIGTIASGSNRKRVQHF